MKFARIVFATYPNLSLTKYNTPAYMGVDNCQRNAYKQKRFSFKYARAFL